MDSDRDTENQPEADGGIGLVLPIIGDRIRSHSRNLTPNQ